VEYYKNKKGRLNKKAIEDLEKQIQTEKYRWRILQQLLSLENNKSNVPNRKGREKTNTVKK